jgi:hypothetical protein
VYGWGPTAAGIDTGVQASFGDAGSIPGLFYSVKPLYAFFQRVLESVVFVYQWFQFSIARVMHGLRIVAKIATGIYFSIGCDIQFPIAFVIATNIYRCYVSGRSYGLGVVPGHMTL